MASGEEICTITAKGQTTVLKAIRQALGVGYGDRIAFRVEGNPVTVHAMSAQDEGDPALAPFLKLLESDTVSRPAPAIRPLTAAMVERLHALIDEMGEIDLDAPIEGDVTL